MCHYIICAKKNWDALIVSIPGRLSIKYGFRIMSRAVLVDPVLASPFNNMHICIIRCWYFYIHAVHVHVHVCMAYVSMHQCIYLSFLSIYLSFYLYLFFHCLFFYPSICLHGYYNIYITIICIYTWLNVFVCFLRCHVK